MNTLKRYELEEIRRRFREGGLPFSGISPLGSAEFHFREPARYLGVALHAGSRVRPGLRGVMAVSEEERHREEDLFTERFIRDFPLQLIARDSRFEYDLNWEEERAIYPAGEKKWGLRVWSRELTKDERAATLDKYREFHAILDMVVEFLRGTGFPVILFDMHAFRYRRESHVAWFDDDKPEVNLGTRSVNRDHFARLIDCFLEGVAGTKIGNHTIRVTENGLFPGGYLTRKYSAGDNRGVLVLAIEYKKLFMDEQTGQFREEIFATLWKNFVKTRDRIIDMLNEVQE